MKKLSGYCKAYYYEDFEISDEWIKNFKPKANAEILQTLSSDSVLYLHDNLSLTSTVIVNETVIFPGNIEGWSEYCHDVLKFAVPAE